MTSAAQPIKQRIIAVVILGMNRQRVLGHLLAILRSPPGDLRLAMPYLLQRHVPLLWMVNHDNSSVFIHSTQCPVSMNDLTAEQKAC